jgi:HD-GYP domain-containing protein (c-di-GMP phosphodiesterase class II)
MPQISEWAAFHHERLDGKGYPFHHTADDLTLGSRIMAVADVFTALTEDRPYRAAMSSQGSLDVLRSLAEKGGVDAEVVRTLANDHDGIDTARRGAQATYAEGQHQLGRLMGRPTAQCAVA